MRRNCAKNPMKKPANKIGALRARFDPDADVKRYLSSVNLLRNAPGKYVRSKILSFGSNVLVVYSGFLALWFTAFFLSLASAFGLSVLTLKTIAFVLAVAGAFVFVAFWVCRAVPQISNWKLGMAGEIITEQHLADAMRRDDWHVFHGFRPDNYGDIDHIVVSPKGVFVIEVKALRGEKVLQNDKGELFLDGKPLRKWNPVEQVEKNATNLRKWIEKEVKLNVFVKSIVCFPDKIVEYNNFDPVVMNPEKLTAYFRARKDLSHMTEEKIQMIAYAIGRSVRGQE